MSKLDIIKEFNKQCGDVVNTALTISENIQVHWMIAYMKLKNYYKIPLH